ncbi:MAG: Glycosyl transferase family 2 [Candidatus Curtissbacteria bacterium GW2011_GWC2_38_9]|uniref:Glycosyltransferase 2-like domain-containing protein n=3 Tax=Candidatus Curtissiibacteriota TaxID=1752717 RepID=A0A1F5HQK5_9BACT|nr:MAG: Glycosyl transferase family 2 [Candidatus Curtissbacteria bacterium GW2011_GWC2_38_9]OGE06471.1 MAG: hypothetical protein A2W70_01235 [Candidatus Curtissbacteria bacterium RIFCSPLOWO2_02_41_11]
MDLSIIIVSYNTKELLVDCLKSIQKAFQFISAEVFVVDNNSSDRTVSLIKKKFPKIKLIANKQNLGFSKANNQAIREAQGKYILILNPDTRLMSDTIIKMIDFMQDNPQVAVSTCKVELPNGQLDRDCRRHFPTPWRAFCHFAGLSKIFATSQILDQYYYGYLPDDHQHEIDSCAGAFMMVRKSAIAEVGLFDEDFFFYGEDLDWCYRFKKAGFKIVYTPITKIIHYKGAASGMKSTSAHLTKATRESKKKAIAESIRAMELFYKKHFTSQYPFFITWLVILGIKILGQIRLLRA